MSTKSNNNTLCKYDLDSEKMWRDLISLLRTRAHYFVYSAHVVYWHGIEEDIVEDIVQETARRVIVRIRQAEHGEKFPIYSLQHMIVVIARNYCIDLRRRDRKLQRVPSNDFTESFSTTGDYESPLEIATEHVYQEELFFLLVHEIVRFPPKQRKALLIDLANRMRFDTELTPLQRAFLAQGIDLRLYRQPLPQDQKERARQVALTSLAYKRVATCIRNNGVRE